MQFLKFSRMLWFPGCYVFLARSLEKCNKVLVYSDITGANSEHCSLLLFCFQCWIVPLCNKTVTQLFFAGFGNMAFSNLIGSNIFDILFCLGVPWLVKTLTNSETRSLHINSGALVYTTLTLLATTVLMLATLFISKWRLNWRVGVVCLLLYLVFVVLACCYELNYFGTFNLPTCAHLS